MGKERFKMVVAVHLLLAKDDKIMLLRRFNTGYEDGNYSLIAGHTDGNEDVTSSMIREAKEEAGITITKDNLKFSSVMNRNSDEERIDFFFVCDTWEGEVKNMEPEKCDDLSWFPLNSLPNNIVPYIKKAIINYLSNVSFDVYGY